MTEFEKLLDYIFEIINSKGGVTVKEKGNQWLIAFENGESCWIKFGRC